MALIGVGRRGSALGASTRYCGAQGGCATRHLVERKPAACRGQKRTISAIASTTDGRRDGTLLDEGAKRIRWSAPRHRVLLHKSEGVHETGSTPLCRKGKGSVAPVYGGPQRQPNDADLNGVIAKPKILPVTENSLGLRRRLPRGCSVYATVATDGRLGPSLSLLPPMSQLATIGSPRRCGRTAVVQALSSRRCRARRSDRGSDADGSAGRTCATSARRERP